jgi:rare lipoprotein A
MRLPVNHSLPLAALVILAGCGGGGGADKPQSGPAPIAASGPAADYPVRVGEPFNVEGTTYTPVDKLNYDEVGYGVTGMAGSGEAVVSIAHKTLPLPSYAEVTSLETGKTILVRVERRGPMRNDRLIEFSPGAADQLGVADPARVPIRIRRVNPPEVERAMLRGGQSAPARMNTPPSLLTVLKRKLDPMLVPAPIATPGVEPVPGPAASPPAKHDPRAAHHAIPRPRATVTPRSTAKPLPAATPSPQPTAQPSATPTPSASARPAAGAGSFLVQVGAFGNRANATAAAAKVGGSERSAGNLTRVVIGPFTNRAAAEAALAKARAAGYRDARIQRAD